MKKVLEHFKNNAIIYLILLTCIIVILIAIFKKEEHELKTVDTSLYTIINLDQAIHLFDDNEPKYLLISTDTCSATASYTDTLRYAMLKHNFKVYYLRYDELDAERDKEKLQQLSELFNTNYTYEGTTRPLITYLGYTPMTVIIKNKKVVYAFIGTMNMSILDSLSSAYGLGDK